MSNTEQDRRLSILNTLLTTPHRDLSKVWGVHQDIVKEDPLFYVRLAAWYNDTGEVRDHKEMFIINLCLSDFEGHREVGLAMARELPPYQLVRVVDFISGKKIKVKNVVKANKKAKPTVTEKVESFGLFRNVPRSLVTEITRYLKEREADNDWFDSSALVARKYLKRLYALLHIAPSERAQSILFDDNPPAGSKLAALKSLAACKTPSDQAKVIMENKIPFRVASTVVHQMTPTVMLALIEVMSDQELINNMGMLKKRGVFDNPDLKSIVTKRLDKAKKNKKVSTLKAGEAVKAANLSEDLNEKLQDVSDARLKSKGRIRRPTALLVDKSGSMSQAIEIGKRIASLVSAVMDSNFYVYAFDTLAYPVLSKGDSLAEWEKAFSGIRANGQTSCGIAFEYMRKSKQLVEQIVIVTDEGDNSSPRFVSGYNSYVKAMRDAGLMVDQPNVIIVKTAGACGTVESPCRSAGISVDTMQITNESDYYSLPNLITFLTRPSRLDLLMEIMTYDLPQRKSA